MSRIFDFATLDTEAEEMYDEKVKEIEALEKMGEEPDYIKLLEDVAADAVNTLTKTELWSIVYSQIRGNFIHNYEAENGLLDPAD